MSITRIGRRRAHEPAVIHGKYRLSRRRRGGQSGAVGRQADQPDPESIDKLLKQAGTSKAKILKANIWLSDIRTFDEMNKVWDGWVAKGNAPARATVEAALAGPEYLVEIMVTAAK